MVLKTCKGRVCTHPWDEIHPDGDVTTLKEALHVRFDDFYSKQPQMWYSECPDGYFAETENQDPIRAFEEPPALRVQAFDFANHWQLFT